jgi:hypothetical protein
MRIRKHCGTIPVEPYSVLPGPDETGKFSLLEWCKKIGRSKETVNAALCHLDKPTWEFFRTRRKPIDLAVILPGTNEVGKFKMREWCKKKGIPVSRLRVALKKAHIPPRNFFRIGKPVKIQRPSARERRRYSIKEWAQKQGCRDITIYRILRHKGLSPQEMFKAPVRGFSSVYRLKLDSNFFVPARDLWKKVRIEEWARATGQSIDSLKFFLHEINFDWRHIFKSRAEEWELPPLIDLRACLPQEKEFHSYTLFEWTRHRKISPQLVKFAAQVEGVPMETAFEVNTARSQSCWISRLPAGKDAGCFSPHAWAKRLGLDDTGLYAFLRTAQGAPFRSLFRAGSQSCWTSRLPAGKDAGRFSPYAWAKRLGLNYSNLCAFLRTARGTPYRSLFKSRLG